MKPLLPGDAFPIAVWLQSPQNAARYKAIGVNLYVALWQGPTDAQLDTLRAAKMPVICEQNALALQRKSDPTIVAWMHGDEPDNAQPDGKGGYGPCVPPQRIVDDYQKLRAADPSRPILLNLGQGVANDAWIGRGAGAKLDDYRTYVQGGDIVSFDVYPVASGLPIALLGKGLDRLHGWTAGKKPIWNCLECTHIDGTRKATPAQVRREAWLSLIHGAQGLIWFVHEFKPKFNEHALLDDLEMAAAVTALNRQIQTLAPVLRAERVPVRASAGVDVAARRRRGALTVLAAANADDATELRLEGLPDGIATDLDDGRRIPVRGGVLVDGLAADGVRRYRVG